MMEQNVERSQWRSSFSYFLVTSGAVVGLSNLFTFPYLTIKYGGMFFLFFILAQLVISLPLMLAELTIGRRGRQNPVGSVGIVCRESQANKNWRKIGWVFFLLTFLTISFYTVRAAFPISFFSGLVRENITPTFWNFFSLEICFLVFLAATLIVVSRGINKGLEAISFITIPLYFLILLGLAIYVSQRGFTLTALSHMFNFNTTESMMTVFLTAVTLALFNLNVGMGSMIVYGSYLPYTTTIPRSSFYIFMFDLVISILSYLIIYPLYLETNFASAHTELNNHNVITIFKLVKEGWWIGGFYFFAAMIAAWTPTIAMAETLVVTLAERFRKSRIEVIIPLSIFIIIIGTYVALTQTVWSQETLFGFQLYNSISNFSQQFIAPIAALCVAIFAGWIMKNSIFESELHFSTGIQYLWKFAVSLVIPIAIVIIGILDFYYYI